jgi:ankyrin repeat protein
VKHHYTNSQPSLSLTQNIRTTAQFIWREALRAKQSPRLLSHPDFEDARSGLGWTRLHKYIRNIEMSSLARQLERDPRNVVLKDCWGATLLHWAAYFANFEAISLLVALGADVNATCREGESVLHSALAINSVQWFNNVPDLPVQALPQRRLQRGHIDEAGFTRLEPYISHPQANSDLIELLLRSGCDPEGRDALGTSALMRAATFASSAACRALLDWGADIDGEDDNGYTALLYAVEYHSHSNVQLLVDRAASLGASLGVDFTETLFTYTVIAADIETMSILQELRLTGILMDPETVKCYWSVFMNRKDYGLRQYNSEEEEIAAFQALLDSIIPGPDHASIDTIKSFEVPGAYPEDTQEVVILDED